MLFFTQDRFHMYQGTWQLLAIIAYQSWGIFVMSPVLGQLGHYSPKYVTILASNFEVNALYEYQCVK